MSNQDKVFTGSIPEIYDTYLVPLIFEFYASDLARRVANSAPNAVLETAAGSGVVTRALASAVSPNASLTITDLNPAMLDYAKTVQGDDTSIIWKPADALELPFDDASFDCVVCQFGVMFFPDRVAGYKEAKRVLKPGGRFIFNAWDKISENEFPEEVTAAARAFFPDDPPEFLPRTPHGYNDTKIIHQDLLDAGFTNITVETISHDTVAPSPSHPAIAFCQGTPLRNEILQRDPDALSRVTEKATEALAARFGDGEITGKIQAHVVTAS